MGFPIIERSEYETYRATIPSLVYKWSFFDRLSTQRIDIKQTKQVPVVTTVHVPVQTVIKLPDQPQTSALPSIAAPLPPSTTSIPTATRPPTGSEALPDPSQSSSTPTITSPPTDGSASSDTSQPRANNVLTIYSTSLLSATSAAHLRTAPPDLRRTLLCLCLFYLVAWAGRCAMHLA
jgi:hypothetical protein